MTEFVVHISSIRLGVYFKTLYTERTYRVVVKYTNLTSWNMILVFTLFHCFITINFLNKDLVMKCSPSTLLLIDDITLFYEHLVLRFSSGGLL